MFAVTAQFPSTCEGSGKSGSEAASSANLEHNRGAVGQENLPEPNVCFRPIADISPSSDKPAMNSFAKIASASLAVIATSALATYIIIFAGHFWSEWNWLWLLGFPLLYAFIFFRRTKPWLWAMALVWLAICSFLAMMIATQTLDMGT